MYKYWKKGIPTHQFRKELVSDIQMMLYIDGSVAQKQTSNQNQQNMLNALLK